MIRLIWDSSAGAADFNLRPEGIDTSRSLETAVMLSLFLDARVTRDELGREGDLRGWWANSYATRQMPSSKLWLLSTRKATESSRNEAREWCEDALEWMVVDGVADRYEVETWWIEGRIGYLGILVTVYQPEKPAPEYLGPWSIYFGT